MAASGGNSMFIKSFDTSGNIKDFDYVTSLFLNVIDQEGADNVVHIITHNAVNFKAAGLSIEAKYTHILYTACVVHSLSLVLKSICEPTANSNHFENCGDSRYIDDGYAEAFANIFIDDLNAEDMLFNEEGGKGEENAEK
ncbi:hypothetical protein AgCh_038302 [Apium graveolens]